MKKLSFVLCSIVLLIASCNTGKINSPSITPVALDANNLEAQDGAQVLQESEPVTELSSLNLEDGANAGNANVANLAISTDALEPVTASGMRVVQEKVSQKEERDAPISQNTNATNNSPVANNTPVAKSASVAQNIPATNTAQNPALANNSNPAQNANATNNAQNANSSLPSNSTLALAEEPVVQKTKADTQNTPVVDMRTSAQNNSNANAKSSAQSSSKATNASSTNASTSQNRANPASASNATVQTSNNTQTRRMTSPLANNSNSAQSSSAQNATQAQTNANAQNRTAQNNANAQNRTAQNNASTQNRTAQSNSNAQNNTQVQSQEEEILPVETELETLPFENLPKVEPLPVQVEPSRSAIVLLNQYLDVVYPGAGWVYLGEVDETKNLLSFHSRKLLNTDTSFVLRAKIAGETILHFYKQDVLTGTYIDDYLAVTVSEEAYTGMEHSVAPAYADVVPPNQQKYQDLASGTTSNSKTFIPSNADAIVASVAKKDLEEANQKSAQENQVATNNATSTSKKTDASMSSTIQIDESSPNGYTPPPRNLGGSVQASKEASSASSGVHANVASLSTDKLLEEAKKAYKNNQMTDSLTYLDYFFAKASTKLDEALFLKGQLYESKKSSFVNVRTALDAYQTLVDEYPSSTLWKKANERITYINRFYFKAR